MFFYANELHQMNKVAGLDNDDTLLIFLIYVLAAYVSMNTIIFSIPSVFLLIKNKKKQPRGFLRQQMYVVQLLKIEGYPSITKNKFYQ